MALVAPGCDTVEPPETSPHPFPIEIAPSSAARIRAALWAAVSIAVSVGCLVYEPVVPGNSGLNTGTGVAESTALVAWGMVRLIGCLLGPLFLIRAAGQITARLRFQADGVRFGNRFGSWSSPWDEVFFFRASPRAVEVKSRKGKTFIGGMHPEAKLERIIAAARPHLRPGALVDEGDPGTWGHLRPSLRLLIALGAVLAAYLFLNQLFLWLSP